MSAVVARDVTPLGVAGMLRCRHDAANRRGASALAQTRDESDLDWQKHVEIGFHMVHGRVPPAAAAAVLHHHRAYDGSGFPYRKRADGDRRSCAADGSISAHRRRRTSLIGCPVQGCQRRIRAPRADPEPSAARAASEEAGSDGDAPCWRCARPIRRGTLVRLSDGTSGVVVGWEPVDPCRPRS